MKQLVVLLFFLLLVGLTYLYSPVKQKPLPSNLPIFSATPTLVSQPQIVTQFIPQSPEKNWDQPWQDACEEASLITVDNYYRAQTLTQAEMLQRYQQMFDYEAQQGWGHDIDNQKMSQIATDLLGYQTKIITQPTLADLKYYLDRQIPLIVTANGKTLYRENRHFKSGGPWYHSLVILGYNDSTQKFTVHDVGTQFGAYYQYSYQLLLDSIHDLPSGGQKEMIAQGEKKFLVLLK